MPISRVRKKSVYTAPPTPEALAIKKKRAHSPPWLAPLMLTLFLLGVLWLVVYYISGGEAYGMREIGNWNLAVGFGLIIAGFMVATQWR